MERATSPEEAINQAGASGEADIISQVLDRAARQEPEVITAEAMQAARELGQKIRKETICLDLKFTRNSFVRRMDSNECIDTAPEGEEGLEADAAYFRVNKELLDRKWLKAIYAVRNDLVNNTLKRRQVNSRMLRGGMFLIPLPLVADVERKLQDAAINYQSAVDAFVANYEQAKEQAKQDLGPYYRESEYLSAEAVRKCYSMKWGWKAFNVSEALKQVSIEVFNAEMRKAEAEWASAADDIKAGLREGLAELIDAAYERLTPDADGKKKTFHDSLILKLQDFFATFEARDLTNDTELQALAAKARNILNGVTAKEVRKSDAMREMMRDGITKLKTEMDELVVKRGRKITLDD